MPRVLIHACCAPCLVSVSDHLASLGHDAEAYFYNPFIHPFKEYKARFRAMQELGKKGYKVHMRDEYELRAFAARVLEMEAKGEKRCAHCYRTRLAATADKARELGIPAFATTLVVSPYQDIELVNRIGKEEGARAGVEYMAMDLRHLHDEGHRKAREMELYMQNYCGCIFSEEERFKKPLVK